MQPDPYEVLGVDRSASEDDIRKAFRRLAREFHPDVNSDPSAEERFKDLAAAYEILSDAERRSTFDRFGHDGLQGQGWAPGFEGFASFADLFGAFFSGSQSAGPRGGGDVAVATDISLADSYTGVTRTVTFDAIDRCSGCDGSGGLPGTGLSGCHQCGGAGAVRTVQRTPFGQMVRESGCPACSGTGTVPESPCPDCGGRGLANSRRTVEVEIPAGIADGQRVRLTGKGNAGDPGMPAGDLFVVVQVEADDEFARDGDDLFCVVDVSVASAALGTQVTLHPPSGETELDVPAGTQPGEILSVKGKGMPSLRGRRHGDLRAVVSVHVPRQLTDDEREMFIRLGMSLADKPPTRAGLFERLRSALGGSVNGH